MNKPKEELFKINNRIRANEIRIVGDNVNTGIYTVVEGIELAEELGVDLVEVSPNCDPPICKLIDYQKFLYDRKKKQKEAEKKQKQNSQEIKELRFGPNTDDHDFDFKCRHAEEFIKDNNKVKTCVFFKGREIQFKSQGEAILLRFAERLNDISEIESFPKLEGKRMYMVLRPKK